MDRPGTHNAPLNARCIAQGAAALVLAGLLSGCTPAAPDESSLSRRVAGLAQPSAGTQVDCAALARQQPLVLLALGQSNAANHGLAAHKPAPLAVVTAQGQCHLSQDPLPGGTGEGASIWSRLPEELRAQGVSRPVVLGLLAVDATSSQEWARQGGPLGAQLQALVIAMRAQGLPPAYVLWQQGEADARAGTAPAAHARALRGLLEQLRAAGVDAPWLLALSTRCRSEPSKALREAVRALAASEVGFALGPDTDALSAPEFRSDGCHLNEAGLTAAARLWARYLAQWVGGS